MHLDEDAAHAPDVEGSVVIGGAEEDVGWPVPQGHHLVRVGVGGDGFRASQACRIILSKFEPDSPFKMVRHQNQHFQDSFQILTRV